MRNHEQPRCTVCDQFLAVWSKGEPLVCENCRDSYPGLPELPTGRDSEPPHPLHEEAGEAEPIRGSSAPWFLAAFFLGALAGAYLHNWIITVIFSGALVTGYLIETAPTMEDGE